MRIVFVGPPGAGKGTQSTRLARHLGVPHLSTGDILRAAKKDGTELGKIVGPIMDKGGLVSDDLIVEVVRERISQDDCKNGYLLDGFPRTLPQAEAYQACLDESGQTLDHVLELRVSDVELRKRLEQRLRNVANPRPDDSPSAIPHRLATYHSETQPVINFYSRIRFDGVLKVIDGLGTMDDVFDRILIALGQDPQGQV